MNPRNLTMKYLSLSALLFAWILGLTNAQSSCGPRIRRSWDAISIEDKTIYKGALAAAMDSGAYIKFVEMHTEMKSEMEAHKQCMFIYWHRLFLVVFENMLRGQGPQYTCVTVPYFNWMEASNRALNGECKTLGECSTIMTELGGITGPRETVVINGVKNTGTCVSESPLNHFCQSLSVNGASCAGCLPRGNWASAKIPATTSYASVLGQLFNGTNIGKVSRAVERGCHNDIHATLGGSMAKFQAPADPIFWSHHAMVDALLAIFHKCRVGTKRMTFEEKAADPVAWRSCRRRTISRATGAPFSPADVVTMRTGTNGTNPIDGNEDPIIGQYFRGVPNRFADLMDVRDLGDSSYSYELRGQLATMYTNCGGLAFDNNVTPVPITTTRAPSPTTTAPISTTSSPAATTRSPVPTTVSPRPATISPGQATNVPATTTPSPISTDRSLKKKAIGFRSVFGWLFDRFLPQASAGRRRLRSCQTATKRKRTATSSKLPSSDGSTNADDGKVAVVIAKGLTPSEKRVVNWYDESMKANGEHSADNAADMERQVCMFQDQCLGGILDYTEEFKTTWGVTESRCRTIVNAVTSGQQTMLDPNWKQKMEKHFGCPQPAHETAS